MTDNLINKETLEVNREINLRGQKYVFKKLIGDFVFSPMGAMDKNNWKKQENQGEVAQFLFNNLTTLGGNTISDEIVDKIGETGQYRLCLFATELQQIVHMAQILTFSDNLKAIKKTSYRDREIKFVEVFAQALARHDELMPYLLSGSEDEQDSKQIDAILDRDYSNTNSYWKYFYTYWKQEIALVKEGDPRHDFISLQLARVPNAIKGELETDEKRKKKTEEKESLNV